MGKMKSTFASFQIRFWTHFLNLSTLFWNNLPNNWKIPEASKILKHLHSCFFSLACCPFLLLSVLTMSEHGAPLRNREKAKREQPLPGTWRRRKNNQTAQDTKIHEMIFFQSEIWPLYICCPFQSITHGSDKRQSSVPCRALLAIVNLSPAPKEREETRGQCPIDLQWQGQWLHRFMHPPFIYSFSFK